ncbi:MAG: NTP transferase domain-containing protein, partial [Candidatus Omnitrophica bacterium]|nr:NTP transferase domain-containing protein [Candidatus Omnitrophota bacterium]
MKALILAAGYAVRLKELTRDTPKSLLEIGGRKIIDRIVEKIIKIRTIDSIYLVTNAKFFEKFNTWLKNSKYRDKISLINDGTTSNETKLGASKDLEIAISEKHIDEDLLVIACDNLFEFELDEFLKFAIAKRRNGVSIAVHDIRDRESAKRFGVVEIDKDKRVI